MSRPLQDDPAYRLWRLFKLLQEEEASDETLGSVLVRVTGEGTPARAIWSIYTLVNAIGDAIGGLEARVVSADSYVVLLEPIEESLSRINLAAPWRSVPLPDERAVDAVRVCSDPPRFLGHLQQLENDQVKSLREQAAQLLQAVRVATELDDNLRDYLFRNLKATINVLDHYDLYGSSGLLQELTHQLGDFASRRPSVPKSGKARKLFKDIVLFSAGVATIITGVEKTAELPAYLKHAYEQLADDVPRVEPVKELLPGPPIGELSPGAPRSGAAKRSTPKKG